MSIGKAASAGLWSTLDIALRQGVGFVVSIILARLLMPSDFGLMALLTFFSSFSIVFVQGGLTTALIQRQQTSANEESSIFWWNLFASAAFAALLILLAPPIAAAYDYPILAMLMPFASAQVVFSALGAVQTALLTRALRFDRLAWAGLFSSLVSGFAGVAAAWWGAGVWALAIQATSLAAVNSAALWWLSDWRPIRHFRFGTIKPLFGFGAHVSLSSALDVLNAQGFALVIGKLHGVRDLGLFYRAMGTQVLPNNILSMIIARVALPLFSARSHDLDALQRGVKMALRAGMLLNVPAMTGLIILADLVIAVLFGDKWLPAAPILAILGFSGILLPLHVINLQILLAQGRSDRFLKVEVVKKLIGLPSIVIGSLFGIEGLAYAVVANSITSFLINGYYTRQSLGYGALAQLRSVSGAFVLSGIMASAVAVARPLLDLSPLPTLVFLVTLGATVYLVLALALVRYRWTELQALLPAFFRSRLGITS